MIRAAVLLFAALALASFAARPVKERGMDAARPVAVAVFMAGLAGAVAVVWAPLLATA